MLSEQCSASMPTVPFEIAFSGTWKVRTWNFRSKLVFGKLTGNHRPKLAHLTARKATSCRQRGTLDVLLGVNHVPSSFLLVKGCCLRQKALKCVVSRINSVINFIQLFFLLGTFNGQ
ncbi:hypothetical protein OS493_019314 [Desmophyllum pertusum]|uniref:Uncharacterized protein n=1 Tax=Desmophyllum pertusum TaxID=174260 RepID=A0A9X0DA41_9CNID|nr:hypothetical protein OS493_019314 [Desmophyllum pertusum]